MNQLHDTKPRIWNNKRPLVIFLCIIIILFAISARISNQTGSSQSDTLDGFTILDQSATTQSTESLSENIDSEEVSESSDSVMPYSIVPTLDEQERSTAYILPVRGGASFRNNSVVIEGMVEDTRCFLNEKCLKDGYVVIKINANNQTFLLREGETRQVGSVSVTFVSTEPARVRNQILTQEDYKFTLIFRP